MPLISVTYVSAARSLFSDIEIENLLRRSRTANAAIDVTGLLLYWDGNFLQYIEGPQAPVEKLLDRIRLDPRHGGLIVLDKTAIAERAFPDWRMAFKRMDLPALAGANGVSNYLADGDLGAGAVGMAPHTRRLIELFREQLS
jgi:hypothetical protein